MRTTSILDLDIVLIHKSLSSGLLLGNIVCGSGMNLITLHILSRMRTSGQTGCMIANLLVTHSIFDCLIHPTLVKTCRRLDHFDL